MVAGRLWEGCGMGLLESDTPDATRNEFLLGHRFPARNLAAPAGDWAYMAPRISKQERALLHETVQYLNLEEMRRFCRAHKLPLHIQVEGPDGRLRSSGDRDRKDVVLKRIEDFAVLGKRNGPTVYRNSVVSDRPLGSRLSARVRLHYGQYDKHSPAFMACMKKLTGGEFRSGMIARLVLRDFWTAGTAPTLRQFADAWLRATEAHTKPRPEGAYLADRAKGVDQDNWKAVRVRKAKQALEILKRLTAG